MAVQRIREGAPETPAGSLRRRLQQDACKVDFTILSPGGDGQTQFVQSLQDGTFTRSFNAVKGQAPSLSGASVDEERSREENGDAVKKKKGGSGDGPPILLIILAAVGGCVLLCVTVCAYLYVRRARKDKQRATHAYNVQQQRSSESGAFGIGISRSFSHDREEEAKEEDLRGSMVLSNNMDPRILGLIRSPGSSREEKIEEDDPVDQRLKTHMRAFPCKAFLISWAATASSGSLL